MERFDWLIVIIRQIIWHQLDGTDTSTDSEAGITQSTDAERKLKPYGTAISQIKLNAVNIRLLLLTLMLAQVYCHRWLSWIIYLHTS